MSDPIHDPWFAPALEPPYHAILFSARIGTDADGRAAFAAELYRLATRSPGFLGAERGDDHKGHLMSAIYWRDRAALDAWLKELRTTLPTPDPRGEMPRFYDYYVMRIVAVEASESGCCPARWADR